MDKKLASRLVRFNRKVAWLLVLSTITMIATGYGQSIQAFNRFLMRNIHLVAEWFFICLLFYHIVVGTFIARYRYRSTFKRIIRGKAGF